MGLSIVLDFFEVKGFCPWAFFKGGLEATALRAEIQARHFCADDYLIRSRNLFFTKTWGNINNLIDR